MKDSNKYVSISEKKDRYNCYQLTSTNDILKNEVTISVNEYCIIIRIALIDDERRYKPSITAKDSRNVHFYTDYNIGLGRYKISEDSNDDEVIIDYN
jgi:hypothetical protein